MSRRLACAVYLGFLIGPALAQTEAPPPTPAPAAAPVQAQQAAEPAVLEAEPARVVVSGRRPGPGVWKVSKDGHVLWVFGLYSPLPRKMEWRSERVERLVAQSQEVLLPPAAHAEVGFFRSLTLLPQMIGMKKSPDGARLHDVLPADVYARWLALKDKYIGRDDGIEGYRPLFAADELMRAGLDKTGLSQGNEVRRAIEDIAKKNKVRLTESGFALPIDDPGRMLKDFKKSQMDDVACFTKTLDRLEGDIDALRVRANAWAKGDIAEIRALDFADREQACKDAVLNGSFAKNTPAFQSVQERLRESWLQAAERSLANNTSTFALLQMKDILGDKGLLAALQAKGYTVDSPQ